MPPPSVAKKPRTPVWAFVGRLEVLNPNALRNLSTKNWQLS
jgi:hypothetical protein